MRDDADDRAVDGPRPTSASLNESQAERLQSLMLEFYFGSSLAPTVASLSIGDEIAATAKLPEGPAKTAA